MKKPASKLLSLLLTLAMVCALFVPAMAADEETVKPYVIPDVKGKVVILHTNDTHGSDVAVEGKSIGTAGVAQLKKDFEAAGATVLLFSAGDFSQGSTLVSLDKGASAVAFMNAAGYDAAALGNHEFDYKMDALGTNVKAAGFPILAANVVDTATKKPLFGDRITFDTPIGKVGVFGLDTPETMTKAHPDNVKGLTFYQGDELVKCAQAQADALRADGCKYVVALTHLGVSEESAPNRSTDIFAKVTGVDVVLDGHSHTVMEGDTAKTAGGALVVSTGAHLANVGVVITDGKTTTSDLISAAQYDKVDPAVAAVVNARDEVVKAELAKVFASTEVLLDGERAPGVRTQETNLGDFAADAILWSAKQAVGEDKVDLAITNGGGIRASIAAGDITMDDMKTVFPFGNEVATVDVTGAELLEALEAATFTTPDAIGAFPQVSGITFTIDTSVPYAKGHVYKDSEGKDTTYFAPAEIGRVSISTVAGEPFDAEATYTLATNDFTAAGGDTYGVLVGKPVYKTGVALEDALVNYTSEVLGGTITAAQYGKSAGRIAILYPDADFTSWYGDAVRYVIDEGMMSGTGHGYFTPMGAVTRATVFQILYNMEGKPTQGIEKAPFNDIDGKWYAPAANWAAFVGLAKEKANGSFGGDDVLTRAELAQIIADYAAYKNITADTAGMAMQEAPDYADIPGQYLEGMTFCYYAGLMTGDQAHRLNPNNPLTRVELAQLLMRFANLNPAASNGVDTEGKYTEKTVSIQVPAQDGVPAHDVPAIVTLPVDASKDAKVPGVVMLHGTGSDKHEAGGGYDIAAPQLAAMGVASIRIDFMGNGDSKASYTDYSYTSANIDAKAAADYLAKADGVDGSKLAVMGWSQGGTNALLAAAKYPDTFKAVVTWSGAPDLTILFPDFDAAYAAAQKDGYTEMTFDWRSPLKVGKQWFEDVKNTDVLKETAKIKAPVLAVNGDQDTVVPMENALAIQKAAQDGQVWIVDGADHTYNVFTGDLAAINNAIYQTASFIREKLDGAAPAAAASAAPAQSITGWALLPAA